MAAGAGTGTPTATAATPSGGDITATIGATLTHTLTGLSISDTRTQLFFTAKRRTELADATALLQVVVSNPNDVAVDGLLVIAGTPATAAQRTEARLVVDRAAGELTLFVADDLMALLQRVRVPCDVKQILADGTSAVLISGHFAADYTPTAAR